MNRIVSIGVTIFLLILLIIGFIGIVAPQIGKSLKELYHEWRDEIEKRHKDKKDAKKYFDSTDPEVRKEFSKWVGLQNEITYAEMFALENEFEIGREI